MIMSENGEKDEYLSICDVWKDSVHKIITKMEYQTPIYLQAYTQVHTEMLHCIDNLFGTCYLWQKQYFDKLGITKEAVDRYGKMYDEFVTNVTKAMDVYANYQKQQADAMVETMENGNKYLHEYIGMYGKAMSYWMSQFKAKSSQPADQSGPA